MMHVTNAVLDAYAAEIAAIGPLDFWAKVVMPRPNDEESLRFHAYRLGSGVWCLTVERLRDMWSGEQGAWLDWDVCLIEWNIKGDPTRRAELFASNPEEIRVALDRMRAWANEKMLEGDKHPGAKLLWWVWDADPLHDVTPIGWPSLVPDTARMCADRGPVVPTLCAQRDDKEAA